jgi:hypothetical protein
MTAAAAVLGFASSLAQGSGALGAGSASVPECDTNGVTVVPNLSGSTIVSVAVGSVDSACGGATLSAAVNNGTASSSGSGTVSGGGGSLTITLAAAVAASDAVQIDVSITGP